MIVLYAPDGEYANGPVEPINVPFTQRRIPFVELYDVTT
jgi:hypothetical protein